MHFVTQWSRDIRHGYSGSDVYVCRHNTSGTPMYAQPDDFIRRPALHLQDEIVTRLGFIVTAKVEFLHN